MLDPKLIRANPALVKEALKKRQLDSRLADDWLKQDKKYRQLKIELDALRHNRNAISESINKFKKEGSNTAMKKAIQEAKALPEKIRKIEQEALHLELTLKDLILTIPNIPSKDVPLGKSEADNKVIRKQGALPKFSFKVKGHEELGLALDLLDIERAAKVAGARFYYLKNEAVLLNLALQKFAIDFLIKKGFKAIEPPFMLKKHAYEGVAHLETFKETLYKTEDEDLYLIATAEHPLAAYFMNEVLEKLPIKFAGISPCFRKEAGAHGKDTKGIFRVHQFNKIEQFIFCDPKVSELLHEELLKNMEQIFKALKIPYRVVLMCSSELGKMASKQYDIEAWFPAQKAYREITSCSNCLDYQARRLNIKYIDKNNERQYVHTLNSTAIATQRTIAAIIENYQQKDGSIRVPSVLQKYIGMKKISKK